MNFSIYKNSLHKYTVFHKNDHILHVYLHKKYLLYFRVDFIVQIISLVKANMFELLITTRFMKWREFSVQMWIQYYSGDYFYSNAASWFTKSQYEPLFTTKMLRECLENT